MQFVSVCSTWQKTESKTEKTDTRTKPSCTNLKTTREHNPQVILQCTCAKTVCASGLFAKSGKLGSIVKLIIFLQLTSDYLAQLLEF